MKLSLRLVLFLIASISMVTFVIAGNQVSGEKRSMHSELERRGEILTESLQETIEPVLARNASDVQLRRIVERFGNRERLVGIAVYGPDGEVLASSDSVAEQVKSPPQVFEEAVANNQGTGAFTSVDKADMFVYALPLHRGPALSGVLVTFHDARYIEAASAEIWREALWHVLAQILVIVLITVLVVHTTIIGPIVRLSQWMKDMRTGRAGTPPKYLAAEFLEPLTSEAVWLGKSLAEARAAAKAEAHLREARDSLWTEDRLRVGIRRRLKGSALFVVSNREPYHHVRGSKGVEIQVPASGLVTALEPILCACDGTWIAHGSADADRETVDEHDRLRVPPERPLYTLRRVWLTAEEEKGYYLGFANEGIWPLCHIAYTRPIFRSSDWEYYKSVNEKFAAAVLQEVDHVEKPFILIQDYHFALLPRILKNARPDLRVGIFWHIPWPNPEAFRICPWQKELLDGLLGADLIGFHVQAHCNNFLETVDQAIECRIEWDRFTVNRENHLTRVRPHPISVVFPTGPGRQLAEREQSRADILKTLGPETLFLGIGIDRIDYTKGLIERFRGIERFLEKYPQYIQKFTFVQFGAPSRTHIKRYQDLLTEVRAEAKRINDRFQAAQWAPIVLHDRHHSHAELAPYNQAADLCMVTSLHDGMNLVAKEFVASRDDEDGVLILSHFTGASRELHDALLVNPYDTEQFAETIRRALEMPLEERRARMQQMRRTVKEYNIYRWAAELISELAEIRLDAPETIETR